MRIAAIADGMADIELGGLRQRTSLLLLPDARVGDYVLVHAGCAITVLDEVEAQERLAMFAELTADDESGAGDE
jgi:hydrogenase expression/formation protein HypC